MWFYFIAEIKENTILFSGMPSCVLVCGCILLCRGRAAHTSFNASDTTRIVLLLPGLAAIPTCLHSFFFFFLLLVYLTNAFCNCSPKTTLLTWMVQASGMNLVRICLDLFWSTWSSFWFCIDASSKWGSFLPITNFYDLFLIK